MSSSQSDSDEPVPLIAPKWQARMYGRCRSRGRNRLAWLFANRQQREFLRQLRKIPR
jgi:hypothetical protein